MTLRGIQSILLALSLALVQGCIPESPPAPPAAVESPEGGAKGPVSQQELAADWVELMKQADSNAGDTRAFGIADELAQTGPEGIVPLIRALDNPEFGALAKVFAVQTVAPHVNMAHSTVLARLTGDDHEATTRACATALLARIASDDVMERLRLLAEDSEPRVSFAALSGLAAHGDTDARTALATRYYAEETTDRERLQIAYSLFQDPNGAERTILVDTLKRQDADPQFQATILTVLAAQGDEETAKALEQAKEAVENPSFDAMVDVCVKAIHTRLGGGTTPEAESGTLETETAEPEAL